MCSIIALIFGLTFWSAKGGSSRVTHRRGQGAATRNPPLRGAAIGGIL